MRARWALALAVPALVLLVAAGMTPAEALPPAASPPRLTAAGERLPLTCPATRPWMRPGSTAAAPLTPQDPTSAVFCVYAGVNAKQTDAWRLIAPVPVPDPSALATALDSSALETWTRSPAGCPMADGRTDVVFFTDQDGYIWSVAISSSGCWAVWSGHTTSYFPASTAVRGQVLHLEGSLRSTS